MSHLVKVQTKFALPALNTRLSTANFEILNYNLISHSLEVSCDDSLNRELYSTLEHFLWTDWQPAYLNEELLISYPFLTADEREYLVLLLNHSIKTTAREELGGQTFEEWRVALSDILVEIGLSKWLDIDALMRFRFRTYLLALTDCVHEVVEQFFADREYEESVNMLRYILEGQPSTELVLHVFSGEHGVWICDVEGELVSDTTVTQIAVHATVGDVDSEDLAMSILITKSPSQIIIHELNKDAVWPSFTQTVRRVFAGRTVDCQGCVICGENQTIVPAQHNG